MIDIIRKHLNSSFVISKMTKDRLHHYINMRKDNYGVYLLYKDNELMYIGRSCTVIKRMKSHIGSKIDWNIVKWVITPTKRLSVDIEHAIIMNYPTPHNQIPKTVKSIPKLYSTFIGDCRRTIVMYNRMVKTGDFEFSHNIERNLKYSMDNIGMNLLEFEMEYTKKMTGEPHRLTKD
jgi:hypothetical protein